MLKSGSIVRSMVTIRLTSSGPRAGNGSPGSWRTYSGAIISSATARLPFPHNSSLQRRAIALFCSMLMVPPSAERCRRQPLVDQPRTCQNWTVGFKDFVDLRLARTPRPHAREAARRDAGDESRPIAELRRREVCVRAHVDAGESLKQRHRTTFGDTSVAVNYQVLL